MASRILDSDDDATAAPLREENERRGSEAIDEGDSSGNFNPNDGDGVAAVYNADRLATAPSTESVDYLRSGGRSRSATPIGSTQMMLTTPVSMAPSPSLRSFASLANSAAGTSSSAYDPALAAGNHDLFVPGYTRAYHQQACAAYNTMALLTRRLKIPWHVFSTGMVFVHHFATRNGWDIVDPMLLACAAFSLAAKAENHGQVRAQKILEAVFRITPYERRPDAPLPNAAGTAAISSSSSTGHHHRGGPLPSTAAGCASPPPPLSSSGANNLTTAVAQGPLVMPVQEEFTRRKAQILKLEMVLLHALDFDVVRKLPYDRMNELVGYLHPSILRPPGGGGDASASGERSEPLLLTVAKKLLSYSFMTPLAVFASPNDIAESIVLLVAHALDKQVELTDSMACRGDGLTASAATLAGIQQTLVTCLIFARKRTGLGPIDNTAELWKARGSRVAVVDSWTASSDLQRSPASQLS